MAGHKPDALLIAALAAGQEVAAAAACAGISERTAYRRLADAAFVQQVRELRAAMVERAVGRLAEASTAAVTTLVANLAAANAGVQVRAALGLLDQVVKLRMAADLEQRVADLEAALAAATGEDGTDAS